MQKVVGSNPISRFEESPAFAGLFAIIREPAGLASEPFSAPIVHALSKPRFAAA